MQNPGSPAVFADGPLPPAAAERERVKLGDRLVAFTALLPPEPPGAVVVAVDSRLAGQLALRFPAAIRLVCGDLPPPTAIPVLGGGETRAVRWDGRVSPLRRRTAGLLVVDERIADAAALAGALAPGGTLAVFGRRGEFRVYPDIDRPELVWRRGWPVPAMSTVRRQLRRSAGLRISNRATRLAVRGPGGASLVDRVLADLERQTGRRSRLVGMHCAGWTILRVRQVEGDLAVRMALIEPERDVDEGRTVAAEVPAVAHLIQTPVARGTTCGVRWVATRWVPGHRRTPVEIRRAPAARERVADMLADGLESAPTGATRAGWARTWCAPIAAIVSEAERAGLEALLAPLDNRVPTGWAHGDIWAANVLLDRDGASVIDWDNSTRDAPLGLDHLLIAAFRARAAAGTSIAAGCARLVDEPDLLGHRVGGRDWARWKRPERAALATAAYVLHLSNRAIYDLDLDALAVDLRTILALAHEPRTPPPNGAGHADVADTGAADDSTAGIGHVARGAGWFAAKALVVKGLQTAVLLVLAAALAPSQFGVIAIGTLVANVTNTISDLGTSTALIYWRGDAGRAARSAVTIALGLSVALTALAWLCAPWLSHVLHADPDGTGVIRGLVSVLPCYAVASINFELLRRGMRFLRRILPELVAAAVGAAVSIVLAVQGHGVAALVVGQIVQGVLTLVLAWAAGGVVIPGWRRAEVRGLLGYGMHLSGSNLAQLLLLNVDYVIVSRVLGSAALGEYSLAFRLAYLPYLNIAFVICGAAFPYLCRLRDGAFGRATERIFTGTVLAVLPVCAGIALLADQLTLLGDKWAPAVPVVRWLMLYAFAMAMAQLVQTSLNATGRPRDALLLRLVHLVTLAIVLVALTRYGIVAVAIGQVLAAMVVCGVAGGMCRKLPGFAPRRVAGTLAGPVLGALAMSVVILALDRALPGARVSGLHLVAAAVAGLLAYAAPVWLLDRARMTETISALRRRA